MTHDEMIAVIHGEMEGKTILQMGKYNKGSTWYKKQKEDDFNFATIKYKIEEEPQIPMQPPWEIIDEKYLWVSRDKIGNVFFWSVEPRLSTISDIWINMDAISTNANFLKFPRGNMPWDKSLVKRPEGV